MAIQMEKRWVIIYSKAINSITMKHLLTVLLLVLTGLSLKGQTNGEAKEGTISFITSQNVYVKFQSTENISVGDTLFAFQAATRVPVLIVKDLSSISCVCTPISSKQLAVNDKITTQNKSVQIKKPSASAVQPAEPVIKKADTVLVKNEKPNKLKESISGRFSLSSYSNFSNVSDFSQRMRYTFSLNAQNIGGSKLSGETYISFVHKINEWSEVKRDIFNGLKIYSLAFQYAINKNNSIWIGRKINPRLSSVGAIDGLQFETKIRSLTLGVISGTRPDYLNYSFNAKLVEFGGYLGHDYSTKNGNMQTSLAFVEQQNNGKTDRRFAYFQHSNSLVTNLYFFGSVEFDLFNKTKNSLENILIRDNTPNLSNLYVSLRYRVIKALSLSLSYNTRKNVVYYETYKDIVDRLLEAATTEGYTFQVNVRASKNISLGANAGYRLSKQDPKPSKNLYSYLTFNKLPWLNASATISATLLETSYLSGSIYSLGISRDLIPGKLYGGVNYRYVKYKFLYAETPLAQNMAEMNLSWRLMKKLSCSVNFEGTFEKKRNYERVYVNITQRF